MSDFLITSTISMAVLLTLYYLLLEKQKMHRFNRLYLLMAPVFSIALPFISIEIYNGVTETAQAIPETFVTPLSVTAPVAEKTNYIPSILWGIYGLVTLILATRFASNVTRLLRSARAHETIPYKGAKLVLLEEPVLPHTFFRYIFISRTDYEQGLIEDELFTHELVHVRQKHTADILFIEALKTIFWFNPLLYFYKKAIQLNHEFLADENVVWATGDVPGYQELLLSKAIPATYYPLASSLNFSITKKRFAMMTRTTSRKTALLLKLSVLPVFAGLIMLLCTETVAQAQPAGTTTSVNPANTGDDQKRDEYYAGVHVKIHDEWNGVYIDKNYEQLTLEQKRVYLPLVTVFEKKTPSEKEFESWKDKKKFAIWLDEKNIDNTKLNNMTREDISTYRGSSVFKNARTKQHPQPYQMSLYTKAYFEKHLKPMGEKYKGTLYELNISKDRKISGNTPVGAVYAMENLIGDKPGQPVATKARDTFRDNAGNIVIADHIVNAVDASLDQDDKVYPVNELKTIPEYPGGLDAFYRFIYTNFKVPEVNEDVTARIYVSFTIEKNGVMSEIETLRDPGYGMGEEAERVLKLVSEKWSPGKDNKGKSVRARYSLPITVNIKK